MDARVREHLLAINRTFYERCASAFAASRSEDQESLRQALSLVAVGDSVLDVGCGNGRAAQALEAMGRAVRYVGMDSSRALLLLAQAQVSSLCTVSATFIQADVTQPDWRLALPEQHFDVVLCLAVLHHIPDVRLRERLMRDMAELLAPDGHLIVSTWQFLNSERLRRKIVPWTLIGLSDKHVEPGDYLLDWQRESYGLRYCHLVDEAELHSLCAQAGLMVKHTAITDKGLNLYLVAARSC